MGKRVLKRLAVVMGATALLGAAAVPPAGALALGPLEVRINVDTVSWAATGLVEETLSGVEYTSVLTATGIESDGARHGTIVDFDTDTGNPSETSTLGGFDSKYAGMEYTLTWTSVLGTTGSFTVTCVEALGIPICTPT